MSGHRVPLIYSRWNSSSFNVQIWCRVLITERSFFYMEQAKAGSTANQVGHRCSVPVDHMLHEKWNVGALQKKWKHSGEHTSICMVPGSHTVQVTIGL